jgi:hypothetical protein
MNRRSGDLVAAGILGVALASGTPAPAWDWDGAAWADYRAFLGPIDGATKAHLSSVVAQGQAAGRVGGRMGQIGDSITNSSAYFRNAILNGPTSNETGHDYAPIRSWLAYSGAQPADANSFYRDHGKGAAWGNASGWEVADATAAGHPAAGVLVGDGGTPGQYSWALLMFGTNDIDAGGWDAPSWQDAYRDLVQGYLDLGVVPVVSTIPPELSHEGDGRVEEANAAVLELAAEMQVPWADYHGLILHHQPTNWVGTLIGADGTHPTAATGGRGFSQVAQTGTDGYALRTKLAFDVAEKLRAVVWEDGEPDPATSAPRPARETRGGGLAAFPSPTRGAVTFRAEGVTAAEDRGATLAVFDAAGRVVRVLPAGPFETRWDGRSGAGTAASPGVYFVRLASEDGVRTARVVVAR